MAMFLNFTLRRRSNTEIVLMSVHTAFCAVAWYHIFSTQYSRRPYASAVSLNMFGTESRSRRWPVSLRRIFATARRISSFSVSASPMQTLRIFSGRFY